MSTPKYHNLISNENIQRPASLSSNQKWNIHRILCCLLSSRNVWTDVSTSLCSRYDWSGPNSWVKTVPNNQVCTYDTALNFLINDFMTMMCSPYVKLCQWNLTTTNWYGFTCVGPFEWKFSISQVWKNLLFGEFKGTTSHKFALLMNPTLNDRRPK